MKAQIVVAAALGILGCANHAGMGELAPGNAAGHDVYTSLHQPNSPNCRPKAHRGGTRLADAGDFSGTAVAFFAAVSTGETGGYAQLDDPTRDWTREQAAGPSVQCVPTGRKHRYFA